MTVATASSLPLDAASAWARAGSGLPVATGNAIRVFEAALQAVRNGDETVLALVVETEGSTYAGTGAMALFVRGGHVGWLSGGCLEPEIERRAREAGHTGAIGWLEIDTRDDESLLTGSAVGCRGRLRMVLLPLHVLAGIEAVLQAWLGGHEHVLMRISGNGRVEAEAATLGRNWELDAQPVAWSSQRQQWSVSIRRPPEVLILGAGPETPVLLPLLRELGWRAHVAERRTRWRDIAAFDGPVIDAPLPQALERLSVDAVLVMHHNFELDREALEALAEGSTPFIGLLGPSRRQEDLFKLLTPAQRSALQPRLRSPVGIDLGGCGPEAIAVSIAAQLQAWRHGAGA